ncbi:DUF6178 family protein [Deferrisoma camini]|uniref:DUF6178 family protein n=1 Tax=Deferrisoma camini TaxID=1035120 RepID=UPI00046CBAF2|nr:DUF6178 family protein [Deferrisoma camini]
MSEVQTPARRGQVIATPLRREIDEILSLRGEAREERLLATPRLAAVVALLPPEELYFTLKEMDPDNVPLVLAHARADQVEFFLDLELWKGDRVRPGRVVPWLRLLASCGEAPLARWLRQLDLADLTLYLGRVVRVVRPHEPDEDPFQDLPGRAPITVDGFYYVRCAAEHEDLVKTVLGVLRQADPDRYLRLMEALLGEVDSELEEHVYQERVRRLAMRGFPEWDEAMEVYVPMEVTSARELPVRGGPPTPDPDGEPEAAPRYPIAAPSVAPDLVVRALGRVRDPAAAESIQLELATLTNRVMVADRLDLDRMESYGRALAKVAGYLAIGLEALAGPDEEAAARLLERHWLQHLFRVGWTRIAAARNRARHVFRRGWPEGHKERLLFLDPPLGEILDGLLRPHPLWYAGDEAAPVYREFRAVSEVDRASRAVDKAEFLGRFLLSVVDLRLDDCKEALRDLEPEHLKTSTVFLTSLVNAALDRGFRFAPIPRRRAREGLAKVWEEDRPPRRVKPSLADASVEWVELLLPLSGTDRMFLREFVLECFGLLEEEFGHLAPDEVPDPRFTRGLWIR